tara:strand:- start:161 stop:697 length:537 start_codon:yes stop_codon:yes gene_type:complete
MPTIQLTHSQNQGLTAWSNSAGTGSQYHLTSDNGGRLYINSDIGIPINALRDDGGSVVQSLRCGSDGYLIVNTNNAFPSIVSLKDNVGINGAYQFNSVENAVKRGQKITLSVRCNTGNTNWTCVIGFSMDGTNWKDTISDINAVASTHQIAEFSVIAPYWRFVFTANDAGNNWTIDYV